MENKKYRKLESQVPNYDLPEILRAQNGKIIQNAKEWKDIRRPEILDLFKTYVYGRSPEKPSNLQFELMAEDKNGLKGSAIQKQINIYLTGEKNGPTIHLLLYLPKQNHPSPVFVGLNFFGNHTISSDPSIFLNENWVNNNQKFKIYNHHAPESSRGVRSERFPIKDIIKSGYGLATAYYGDISPDHKKGLSEGIHVHYNPNSPQSLQNDDWGAISAWAWGISRIIDYLETDIQIDKKRIISFGHSRLGKTSLWAGAQDQRIAMVISNDSGCVGAAISRRCFGETLNKINSKFPHWFCKNFHEFNNREHELPLDQHMLIALIAPRPVYVASADHDLWADPKGEFLSLKAAEPVYKLLTGKGFDAPEIPEVEQPIRSIMGHHIRKGYHNLLKYDWKQYITFANLHLKSSEV